MIRVWPRFHDPAFRPRLRENLAIHWTANLLMLRRPGDIALFTIISLIPALVVVGLVLGMPEWYAADLLDPVQSRRFRVVMIGTLLLWSVTQHFAFVHAMQRTYVPHVRESLRRRGIPVCLVCGDLLPPHDPGAACPECGRGRGSATMTDSDADAGASRPPAASDTEVPRR